MKNIRAGSKNILIAVSCLLFAIAMLLIGYLIYDSQISTTFEQTQSQSEQAKRIKSASHKLKSFSSNKTPKSPATLPLINLNLSYWYEINSDVIGWIYIFGTSINYPILCPPQEQDSYYLNHNIYNQFSLWGCPYIDALCAPDNLNAHHVILYGHNNSDGTMFSDLTKYTDSVFYESHPYAFVVTQDGIQTLKICGWKIIPGNQESKRTKFRSIEEFYIYRNTLIDNADKLFIDSEYPKDTEQLFTLCTCSYTTYPSNERLLVYAIPVAD